MTTTVKSIELRKIVQEARMQTINNILRELGYEKEIWLREGKLQKASGISIAIAVIVRMAREEEA